MVTSNTLIRTSQALFSKLRVIPVLCCCMVALPANAGAVDAAGLNQAMSQIGKIMEELFPLIVVQRALDAQEQTHIRQAVHQMESLFRQAEPHIRQKSSTYQVSYQYMLGHLQTIDTAFDSLDINFVRSQLYELGSICSSCHVQDARTRTLFQGNGRSRFNDDYSYAEFNYVTRNYDEALRYYDAFLRTDTVKTELELVRPLQRLVTIMIQVRNNPDQAVQSLRAYVPLLQHTDETRKQLLGWIKGVKELMPMVREAGEPEEFSVVQRYALQVLADPLKTRGTMYATPEQEISRVWLRGVLFRYLAQRAAEQEIPMLLYWLALCERAIGYDFYFSLADLYLKECMMSYAKHPYARLCFQEYEAYVAHTYSGSAGEFIPEEVQQEIHKLRKLVHQ